MLTFILGSKSAERILLFLLVNECCYASEIRRMYSTALTPLQSILNKLEKEKILVFERQGKIKLYRFNPDYPLLDELKALLKKAFVHLPSEEKRKLLSRKDNWRLPLEKQFAEQKKTALRLDAFWKRLQKIQHISIQAAAHGDAFGDVIATQENHNSLLFTEKGHWETGIEFSNILRWTIDAASGMIALEHLRYGPTRPVFLFHLAPTGPKTLESIDSHLCNADCYFGRIEYNDRHIQFVWRILGPKKNETLRYIYT